MGDDAGQVRSTVRPGDTSVTGALGLRGAFVMQAIDEIDECEPALVAVLNNGRKAAILAVGQTVEGGLVVARSLDERGLDRGFEIIRQGGKHRIGGAR